MSTLSSSNSRAEIEAAYDDNASYLEDSSVAKCKAFITAARLLIRITAASVGTNTGNVSKDVGLLREEIADARRWLASNATVQNGGAGTKFHSLEDFRS